MEVTLKSYPKVNIGLYVGSRRKDNFHAITSIFHRIDSVHDTITVSWNPNAWDSITVRGIEKAVPEKESTCYRACELYMQKSHLHGSVEIAVVKNIPVLAGLGGGSSNAATVLLALQELTGSIPDAGALADMGLTIGSDVPFFLCNSNAAVVSGRGEEVRPITARKDLHFTLVSGTGAKHGTGNAYSMLDKCGSRQNLPSASELMDMYMRPVSLWNFENDFEKLYSRPAIETQPNERFYLTGAGSMWYRVTDSQSLRHP